MKLNELCVEIYLKPSDVVFETCACRLPEGLVLDATWHVNLPRIYVCHCLLFVPTEYFHFKPEILCCNFWTHRLFERLLFFLEVSIRYRYYATVQFYKNSVSSAKQEKFDL